jgi:hypothetical protein
MWSKKTCVLDVIMFLTRASEFLRKHFEDNGFDASCAQRGSTVPLRLNISKGSLDRTRREGNTDGWS